MRHLDMWSIIRLLWLLSKTTIPFRIANNQLVVIQLSVWSLGFPWLFFLLKFFYLDWNFILLQWNPLYGHPLDTDARILLPVLFVPTKSSYILYKTKSVNTDNGQVFCVPSDKRFTDLGYLRTVYFQCLILILWSFTSSYIYRSSLGRLWNKMSDYTSVIFFVSARW